jgi:hypothetical protein
MNRAPVSKIDRPDGLPGVTLVTTEHWGYESAPHAREEWTLGLCPDGLDEFRCESGVYRVEPGQIIAIPPGRIHSDRARAGRIWMIYAASLGVDPTKHGFAKPVFTDPELARRIARLFSRKDRASWNAVQARLLQADWLVESESVVSSVVVPWSRIRRPRAVGQPAVAAAAYH